MKHLNQFITEYIIKKKLDKPIDSEHNYKYFPETKRELIDNIKELLDKEETDLNCIDTSKITNMTSIFFQCINFDCDLSNWDVSNVEDMNYMFQYCKNFEGKGLENWDVSNIINMNYMFYECENLNCNLSNWDVSKAQNMSSVFDSCTALKNKPSWCKE